PMPGRPLGDAEATRRLDAARERRRAKAGRGRHRRGLGALAEEPGRRLVWAEEGVAGPLRELRAARDGGARARRGGARAEETPDAGDVPTASAAASSRRRPAWRARRSAAWTPS